MIVKIVGAAWLVMVTIISEGQAATAWNPGTRQESSPGPVSECIGESIGASGVHVHLTISSLTMPRSREIEMHWKFSSDFEVTEADTVVMTVGDPEEGKPVVLESVSVSGHPSGYARTKRRYMRPELRFDQMKTRCSRYWVAYTRDDQVLAKNCLRISASWMWDNREALSNHSLHDVFLPGTHNSGTYKRSREILYKLAANQGEDVWSQLMYGIRYLDLRVGYRDNNRRGSFWIYHDFMPIRPIKTVVNHIKWFMNYSQEILIVDFHRFPKGFDDSKIHDKFVGYLRSELGEWMMPWSVDSTLGDLWRSQRRLVVTYADIDTVRRNSDLWPAVNQAWGDQRTVEGLYRYLRDQMAQPSSGYMWSAMAELTPNPWDLIIPHRGLRDLAQMVNSRLTDWFRDKWWRFTNIVASDFFLGNDLINVAVDTNLRRQRCRDER